MRILSWLAALLLIVSPAAARAADAVAPQEAAPALWTVEHGGKKLYLFGSIHLLPQQTAWTRPRIDEAIAAADVFVFEAPLDQGGQGALQFVEEAGKLKGGQTLEDVLTAELFAEVEKAAWKVQYPPRLLAPLRPWLAAVYLELYAYLKVGFSSYYGVDFVIEQRAKGRGAELAYLETVAEQLGYFAALDRKTEVAYLKATAHGVLSAPNLPFELLNAWGEGRTDELARLVDDGFKNVPQLREKLIAARNRKWLAQLRRMIASEKTHFVTVGAGHLAGRDSLVAMLRAKGYKVLGP